MDDSTAPFWARSWVALWVLTLLPVFILLLAGFDVGKFYLLWKETWEGIATIMAIGLGAKFGKDTFIKRAEISAKAKLDEASLGSSA